MQRFCKKAQVWKSRCLGSLGGLAAFSLSLSGCAGFWDEVTSRNFNVKHFYEKPNPFVVLQNSNDGNERAQALYDLHDPGQYSALGQDQEAVLKILATAASKEKQFLCRAAAIDSLGKFKDPRAVTALTEAFYASGSFAPDLAVRIQTRAATSLGETRQPQAMQFLVRLVQEKPRGEGADLDKQQIMDVRIAAARALGNFHDPQAIQALQEVLNSEKDIALRDSVKDSIELAAGTKKPWIDWQAIENFILPAGAKQTN